MEKSLRSILAGLLLAAFSAALLTLAFPPYNCWPLVFVGLIPAILAQHYVMPARWSGLAYGLAIGGFFWGYFGFGQMFAGAVWYMRWLPVLIGVIAAAASSRDRLFHQRTRYRWLVLQGAVIWTAIEAIRGMIPVVGTWGFLPYALYRQAWLIQPVSTFSIYGLTLLIALFNYALAYLLLACLRRRDSGDRGLSTAYAARWVIGAAVLLLVWIGLSLVQLDNPEPELTAAAVQQEITSTADFQQAVAMTRQAAQQGAELVVWPEGGLNFDPQQEHADYFADLARENDVCLVLGYAVRTKRGLRNEAVAVDSDGTYLGVYGKDHPVAWGGETSISGGTHPAFESAAGNLGMVICYDADFTDSIRKVVRSGARVVAVPSQDWSAIAAKHYTHLVFRAVENRVAIVKADGAYDSAILDPYGRIVAHSVGSQPHKALVAAPIPLGTGRSLVVVAGDWVGWLSLAGMGLFIGWDISLELKHRRSRRQQQNPSA